MRVLVVNAGSSSLKLSVVSDGAVVVTRGVDRWQGELDPLRSFAEEVGNVDALGHRVVHGGPEHATAALIDDALLHALNDLVELAPLHQPRALAAIDAARRLLPGLPHVACFDTAFHRTMPAAASTYALPAAWNTRWALRRYGFHGLSHAYAVRHAPALVGSSAERLRVVSCHLGSGSSLCAAVGGRSVDTTMGFTPLAGLVMATRSGSVDPGLVLWLLKHGDLSPAELADVLEHGSGMAGLSGTSGDLRDVLAARSEGSDGAALAYDVFLHRLVSQVAAMTASAGGLDLLVLTGGIGEHSPVLRHDLAQRLGHLGVAVDEERNADAAGDSNITARGAPVRTVVVTAGEDKEVAAEVSALLEP